MASGQGHAAVDNGTLSVRHQAKIWAASKEADGDAAQAEAESKHDGLLSVEGLLDE